MSKLRIFALARWLIWQSLAFAMVVLCAVILGAMLGTLVGQLVVSFPTPPGHG